MNVMKEDKERMQFLSSYLCREDQDIQQFLPKKAVEFEKRAKSRTYLVLNQEELDGKRNNPITIYGYISVGLKILTVPDNTSNSLRKELDGFSARIRGKKINNFPCYLMGQLSRNSNVSSSVLKGSQLIEMACSVIDNAVETVGGRYIMIECKDNEKLIQFYEKNQFRKFNKSSEDGMVQMIRKI